MTPKRHGTASGIYSGSGLTWRQRNGPLEPMPDDAPRLPLWAKMGLATFWIGLAFALGSLT